MFKKLRNHFLLLNMAIISILLISAFSVVYAFTYNNTQRDIDRRLSHTLTMGQAPDPNMPFPKREGRFQAGNQSPQRNGQSQAPQLSTDFTIDVDADGTIVKINSVFDIEESIYQETVAKVLESGKTEGRLKSENTLWAFKQVKNADGGAHIAFLDISAERRVLNNLILTFAAVGLLCLLLIILISLFFANRAIRPIEAAWQKQKQFIADASHELKTPLTTINTNVDVLLAHSDETIAEQSKWLLYIKGEAERMSKLTNDLLYLANLDHTEDKKLLVSSFSLSEAVESVMLTSEAALFEKEITVEEEIQPEIEIRGNQDQIKQLILILLDNAMKYTPPQGRIAVTLHRQEKLTSLCVSNTGEEIPKEDREKIFDRFYRTDKSRARESGGYGLGLAIARAIAESHSGSIGVRCEDHLNTFTVILPAE